MSSFAGNELLISPDWLIDDGLVRRSDSTGCALPAMAVDFDRVREFKYGLLGTAWRNFSAGWRSDLRPVFEQFGLDHVHWLNDSALFRALKARYGGASYWRWRAIPDLLSSAAFESLRELTRASSQTASVESTDRQSLAMSPEMTA